MIWQNPLAWIGLAAIAAPLLIHMLSRHRSRVQPFPTLRFLTASRLAPARQTRFRDPLLFAVRAAILAAAVAALAQPVLLTAEREAARENVLARVIVVDTSASMSRTGPTTERPVDAARRIAAGLAADAAISVQVETALPARELPGAVAWLAAREVRGEVAVISDFQVGTLDSVDVAALPAEIGFRLFAVPDSASGARPAGMRLVRGNVRADITLNESNTAVEWTVLPSSSDNGGAPRLFVAPDEEADARAALNAAVHAGVPWPTGEHRIGVVHPGYPERDMLLLGARSPDRAWMGELIATLRSDADLAAAAVRATSVGAVEDAAPFPSVARSADDPPLVIAAAGTVDGGDGLLLFSRLPPASLASAALLAAVAKALSPDAPANELEPDRIDGAVLARWQREPASASRTARLPGASDGRWLWILALALIVLEGWMRRTTAAAPAAGVLNDGVS